MMLQKCQEPKNNRKTIKKIQKICKGTHIKHQFPQSKIENSLTREYSTGALQKKNHENQVFCSTTFQWKN